MSRTVLVTGGAQGIGSALAHAFAQAGDRVAIADLAYTQFDRRDGWLTGPCDVSDRASCEQFLQRVVSDLGPIEILVNNAGIYPMQRFEEITPDDWNRVLATNLGSVFHMSQLCIPNMRARSWGRIINIASNTFFMGTPNLAHYVASKGAMIGLSRSLAAEIGGDGITVNCVAPNFTRTEGTSIVEETAPQVVAQIVAMQAIPRVSEPKDVIGTVMFLASSCADFLTGQTIVVDGGAVKC